MKINQLFREHIPEEIYNKLLRAFAINPVSPQPFSKDDLYKHDIIEKIKPIISDIRIYYLPCKAQLYLDNLTIQKCITILRQISKLFGKVIVSTQKPINHKKVTFYSLRNNIEPLTKIRLKYKPVHIDFS